MFTYQLILILVLLFFSLMLVLMDLNAIKEKLRLISKRLDEKRPDKPS